MAPGHFVFIRYASDDPDILDSEQVYWRRVQVVRKGHIRETGCDDEDVNKDPEMDGWWCCAPPATAIYKFFLRRRILELDICL